MSQVVVFLSLVFAILIAIFAVQNTVPVTVQFLAFHADNVAVSVLVLIAAALGALAMLLLGIAREIPMRWRHRSVSHQLRTAQARVAELEKAQAPTTTIPANALTSPTSGDTPPEAPVSPASPSRE